MTKEIWKDIPGYEGLYQVSNIGRIKRLESTVMQWNPQLQKKVPVVYKKRYLNFETTRGYNRATLSKDNKQQRFQVHRLVAEAFVPNPDNKPCVNHINHIRIDNRADNLEWVTYKENEAAKGKFNNKPFKAIDPEGNETIWYVQLECARQLKLSRHGIRLCLNGTQESCRGYTFSYINAQ